MASRQWINGVILAKMGGGLLLMAIPASMWYFDNMMSLRAWIVGALGLGLFCWGLFAIGDKKSEWE